MDVVIAVDGGGTKTDIAVLSCEGEVLARHRFGSFTPDDVGTSAAVDQLDGLVSEALAELGPVDVAVAGMYFSGLDFPYEVEDFRAEASSRSWSGRRLLVDNDTFALLRAGTDEPTAVAVVCGTGTNCVARRADGAVVRFAALGDVSGDWGGGAGLGMSAIWHAARAADGRGPATLLEPLILKALGRESMADVIIGYHKGELDFDTTAALAPLIFEASSAGDAVARSVVQHQADEVIAFVRASLTRLDVLGQPCPVVLGGGVIAGRDPDLLHAIDKGLAAEAPGTHAVIVSDPPILGAALLAFDELGVGADVLATVRAGLSTCGGCA